MHGRIVIKLQWKLDFRMNGLNFEKEVDHVRRRLEKDTQLRKTIPTEKRQNSLCLFFFPQQSFVNAFTSSYYFYVNVGNMHTKIIPLNTRYSIIKKYEKLRQILIISQSLIKVRFKGKGSSRNHTKLNRFIYIKNIAVTL